MLEALALFPGSPARLGLLSGYVPGGSTYRKYLSTLRSAGLVERGALQLTDAGLSRAGAVTVPTRDEMTDFWRARLGGGERKLFDAIMGFYPEVAIPDRVSDRTGYEINGSTWRKYVSTLRSLGLLERGHGAPLKIAAELFA
jgi:hypothetical protein